MRVRKRNNFGPSSLSRFHTSDDSRIAEMGPGRLERPEGDEEPSVLPPRSRSDQVVQLWNRRCTREHHGKKWDFLWLSQMRNWRALLFSFRWTSLLFWAWYSWRVPAHLHEWQKIYTDASPSPEWFPNQTECIFWNQMQNIKCLMQLVFL